VPDDRRVEATRNGDSISRRSSWRVVSLPSLVNSFLLPTCKEIKLLRTHFRNKCNVPLPRNPCIPGFQHQMFGVAISGSSKVRHLDTQLVIIGKELT
jgi:hypothetical protein